jgi:mercuric ion binding protein
MKKVSILAILMAAFLSMIIVSTTAYTASERVVLHIEGMHCATCPFVIKKALQAVDGVEKVSISLKRKRAEVFFDPDKVGEIEIANTVNQIGYEATVVEE